MRRSIVAVIGLSAACQQTYSLRDVPVLGGTDAQQQAVLAELAHIGASMEADDLQLAPIRIRNLRDDSWGRYRGRGQRIELASRLSEDRLRITARHEVCHALDHDLGWPSGDRHAMDQAAAWWRDRTHAGVSRDTTEDVRHEAFALICEQGIHGAGALADPCQGLDPEVRDEIAWVVDLLSVETAPEIPTSVLIQDLDVQHLGAWDAWVSSDDELVLDGEANQLTVAPDGTTTEGPSPSGNIAQPWDNGADVGFEPLVGADFASRESSAGRLAVIGTLSAAQHPSLFIRDADGRWDQRGCAMGDSAVMWDTQFNVWIARAPSDEDRLDIEILD